MNTRFHTVNKRKKYARPPGEKEKKERERDEVDKEIKGERRGRQRD